MNEHVVNSDQSLQIYLGHVKKLFVEKKYLTFPKPRIGQDRSIKQNSLFHMFCTEYAAHLTNVSRKGVSKGLLEGMKRKIKAGYYNETKESFMVHYVVNPFKEEEKRLDYTSSKDWKTGEMKCVIDWIMVMAANDGLVLESKGVHAALSRKELE